jgi:low affinity Fe/Cu permease
MYKGIAQVSVLQGLGYAMIGAISTMVGALLVMVVLILGVAVMKSNGRLDFSRLVSDVIYVIGWALIALGCFRGLQSIRHRRRPVQKDMPPPGR